MNDQQVEQRLREELRRRLAQGDPSDRLVGLVAHLGAEEAAATPTSRLSVGRRMLPTRHRSSALGGLAAAACIVAVLGAALLWRPALNPLPGASPTSDSASPITGLTGSPAPSVTWNGRAVTVSDFGRVDAGFSWVLGSTDGQTDAIFVTTDGGVTWDMRPVPYGLGTRVVNGPVFVDRDHIYFAVTTGQTAYTVTVMRSSDGGHTWAKSVVLQDRGYDSMNFQMADSQHGWLLVVDSRVVYWLWRTTDGGVTWQPLVDTLNQHDAPSRIDFVSDLEGWGYPSSRNGLVRTFDGGKSWSRVSLPAPAGYSDVSVVDSWPGGTPPNLTVLGTASASGDSSTNGLVTWKSSDGGANWNVDKVEPYPADAGRLGPQVKTTYSAGQIVTITLPQPDGPAATFDATGINAFVAKDYVLQLTSARAFSATEAWVAIDSCAQGGTVGHFPGTYLACAHLLATPDAGKTWRPLLWTFSNTPAPSPTLPAVPACCSMNSVGERQVPREPLTDWLDAAHGWAIVGTTLRWTVDGGKTWDSGSPLPASGTVQFLDSQHGWLIATGTSDPVQDVYTRMPVYRTTDGGKTWIESDIPWTAANIPTVSADEQANWQGSNWVWGHFADTTHGVVARCSHLLAGQIDVTCQSYTTDDGGVTFQGPVTKTYATAITWLSPTLGWAVGGRTTPELNVTTDGGRTWTKKPIEGIAGASWFAGLAMAPKPDGGWRLLMGYATGGNSTTLVRYETTAAEPDGTWTRVWQGNGPAEYLGALRVAGDGLVALSDTHFWSSSDFGQTWHQGAVVSTQPHDFAFTDATTGWMVQAPTYDASPEAVLGTTDGGRTWHVVLQVPSVVN